MPKYTRPSKYAANPHRSAANPLDRTNVGRVRHQPPAQVHGRALRDNRRTREDVVARPTPAAEAVSSLDTFVRNLAAAMQGMPDFNPEGATVQGNGDAGPANPANLPVLVGQQISVPDGQMDIKVNWGRLNRTPAFQYSEMMGVLLSLNAFGHYPCMQEKIERAGVTRAALAQALEAASSLGQGHLNQNQMATVAANAARQISGDDMRRMKGVFAGIDVVGNFNNAGGPNPLGEVDEMARVIAQHGQSLDGQYNRAQGGLIPGYEVDTVMAATSDRTYLLVKERQWGYAYIYSWEGGQSFYLEAGRKHDADLEHRRTITEEDVGSGPNFDR